MIRTSSLAREDVSGSASIAATSSPASAAAAASIMAPPQPELIIALGTPTISAMEAPATFCSSQSGTNAELALSIAADTSGCGVEPPRIVTEPVALITGVTPISL
jgi:hypothetical protein